MTGKPIPTVLWDIDGTLLVAGDGGLGHYHNALRAVVADAPTPRIDTHGKTDWQVIHELLAAAQLDAGLAPAVLDALNLASTTFLEDNRLQLLPAVPETLHAIGALGYHNGLLTGNSRERARNKLAGSGLDLDLFDWAASFFGSDAIARADIAIAARAALADTPMLIIGDTPFDGEAARAGNIAFLAVCSGNYSRDQFDDSTAVAVIDKLDAGAVQLIADALLH